VLYYRPDYRCVLQEFLYQVEDDMPEIPRIKQFLIFWKNDIDAVIHSVLISESNSGFRPVNLLKIFN